jgi:uncharacterized MAPEG superfamily protein
MSFALWMILVAILLPIMTTGLAKWGASGFDNNQPRVWQETLTGWRKRAEWAQRNHFEALAPFAAAVLVATITHANPTTVNALAGIWALCRIAYTACYITDRASLRSLAWAVAFCCVIGLFVVSA